MIRATYPSYLGPPLRGPSFYGARYCALIRPRGACRLGGEMYEPVRGPWFVVREPPADPPARRSACPPIRLPADPWCFCPGARFRAAIVKRHIARDLLKRGGVVCARAPRSARRGNGLSRTMRD